MTEKSDLTLEKMKIAERLVSLEISVKEMSVQVKNSESLFLSHITDYRKMLYGNGGNLGMVTRLDRVEQVEKVRAWTIRAIVVAILAVFGKMITDVWKH